MIQNRLIVTEHWLSDAELSDTKQSHSHRTDSDTHGALNDAELCEQNRAIVTDHTMILTEHSPDSVMQKRHRQ